MTSAMSDPVPARSRGFTSTSSSSNSRESLQCCRLLRCIIEIACQVQRSAILLLGFVVGEDLFRLPPGEHAVAEHLLRIVPLQEVPGKLAGTTSPLALRQSLQRPPVCEM